MIEFKALGWSFKDEHDRCYFYVSGISSETPEGKTKSVRLRIDDFSPCCYLQLPEGINWTDERLEMLQDHILSKVLKDKREPEEGKRFWGFYEPVEMRVEEDLDFYSSTPRKYIYLEFTSRVQAYSFAQWMTKQKHRIRNWHGSNAYTFDRGDFTVHEQDVDPIIRMVYDRKVKLAAWVKAENAELLDEDDQGPFYACSYEDFGPSSRKDILFPKYLSFDFECYSKNWKAKHPDAEEKENCIFHISAVLGRVGGSIEKIYLLTPGEALECTEIEPLSKGGYMRKKDYRDRVEIKNYDCERTMLLGFSELIREENPDIITGYNILKFDWAYFLSRLDIHDIRHKGLDISRIPELHGQEEKMFWASSAYGTQEAKYVSAPGRVNVDVILEIQRNYKLPVYSLDAVAEKFLGERKEDVSPSQLFMIWHFYRFVSENRKRRKKKQNKEQEKAQKEADKKDIRIKVHTKIEEFFPKDRVQGFLVEYRSRVLQAKEWSKMWRIARELITITGYYCVIDSILPIDIMEKLNLWFNMEALSNIMNVPSSYLHVRGQQIRVLAQLYELGKPLHYVFPLKEKDRLEIEKKSFMGAIVVDGDPGVYDDVAVDDFESLYPSIMISENICHSTFLDPENPEHEKVPDEEATVTEWSQHVGCEHDTVKRKQKVKKEKVLCGDVRVRHRAVKYIEKDGKIVTRGEGVIPRLLRRLLGERKAVRAEMGKFQALLDMHRGKATEQDVENFQKRGFRIVKKGELSSSEEKETAVRVVVMNAQQLGLKISANSVYGFLAAMLLKHKEGSAKVTAVGRRMISDTIKYITTQHQGTVIYGDTDSVMVQYRTQSDENPFDRALRVAKATSHHLKCLLMKIDDSTQYADMTPLQKFAYDALPINLQFENYFKRMILLTKKRYMALIVNRKGEVVDRMSKGTVKARRDNCSLARKFYGEAEEAIFNSVTSEQFQDLILKYCHDLLTRNYDIRSLVIYKAIAKFEKYAMKEKGEDKRILSKKRDDEGRIIPGLPGFPTSSGDPLDWYYDRPPAHLCLALKMLGRGDQVPANTRMEYIFLKTPNPKAKQGEKVEDLTYYLENGGLELDIPYYIERQFCKPISELLYIGCGKPVPYKKSKEDTRPLKDRLESAFSHLPGPLRTFVNTKKGIRQKVFWFLNNFEKYTDYQIQRKDSRGEVRQVWLDEILKAEDLCREWYREEKMNLYFHNHGVGKSKLKRKRNKEIHPFFMDILQTAERKELLNREVETLFGHTRF